MSDAHKKLAGRLAILAVGLAAPFLFPAYQSQMAELWLFVVFALTWDLAGGQMGYNSFGNVVFLGIGMYACVLTQVGLLYDIGIYNGARGGGSATFVFDLPHYLEGLALGLPVGALLAALAAAVLGAFVLGMRGHYFAICTLGLGVAAGEVANSWEWIGAGSGMVPPTPPQVIGDLSRFYYYFAFALAAVTFLVLGWLYRTRFGLAINAIRDDEDKAEAMGLQTTRIKVAAWVIAAVFLGVSGGILGNLKRFIDPIDTAFSGATFGVWMVLMAILGGKGTLWGPVIGAVLFEVIKEATWTYLLGWQRVALGLLIVIIVVFFPQGILGWLRERFPDRFGRRVEADLSGTAEETAR
ncbi:amino acid/amide ABC transporter membrane protein 2, HAAT family [Tistlia consotensis]|uniref:Amino acid/amide ABC transporter membrane protein 2, HAAT family n=1 Tax=Tistlia consotensis USBA 355 TaxID=560819 RepID=A0A1Y6CKQ8_9PROT|nr:branched-chain amino acid ABC transporter permease [Tistlia consotensis]SMF69282.1 amino acid/amide ABC transporter membrane protein 2, HAAT family [Tistlia consotensis USBA 355]SNS02054.1 amino acid/amide ABC transporter membrane protein 2, HAAT family [Tistlia consotensis]